MAKGTGADSYREEMPNGTGNFQNFQISRKKDNHERWTEIFETIFQKLSVPFDFELEFLEILVEWNASSVTSSHSNKVIIDPGVNVENIILVNLKGILFSLK